MKHWPLTSDTSPCGPAAGGLLPAIGAIGAAGFADAALRGLNAGGLRAASWSVYQLRPGRAPVLHLSASLGVADRTGECFRAYHQGLYRRDCSFDAITPGRCGLLRMHADEAPNAAHREAIYRRHQVLERLSVAQRTEDDGLFAVNLYHHDHQGPFGDAEVAGFAALAPLLLAAVQRHVALQAPAAPADPRGALQARCPALTARELDVCERLLRGWSYDGIAADMGLSVATVKTYRARAFERLGLHFKSELFAAFMPAAAAH